MAKRRKRKARKPDDADIVYRFLAAKHRLALGGLDLTVSGDAYGHGLFYVQRNGCVVTSAMYNLAELDEIKVEVSLGKKAIAEKKNG